jgi:hypothetical protein
MLINTITITMTITIIIITITIVIIIIMPHASKQFPGEFAMFIWPGVQDVFQYNLVIRAMSGTEPKSLSSGTGT